MITQNPIVGRSRKKLAGVYARTLWGMNVIQSLPSKSNIPPTQALKSSRNAFAVVQQMCNMIFPIILPQLYYEKPVGRSRRHCLSSDFFTGVIRQNKEVFFDLSAFSRLGSNPVTSFQSLLFTPSEKNFSFPTTTFPATERADTTKPPCIFVLSYELATAAALTTNVTLQDDTIFINNLSDTFLNNEVLFVCLWQTNVGTVQYPNYVFGSFDKAT